MHDDQRDDYEGNGPNHVAARLRNEELRVLEEDQIRRCQSQCGREE